MDKFPWKLNGLSLNMDGIGLKFIVLGFDSNHGLNLIQV